MLHTRGKSTPNAPDDQIPFSRHATYEYDVRGLQTRWEVSGSGDAAEDGGRVQIRRHFPSGLLRMRRAHKLDPSDPEGPPLEIRRYGYAYNPNRSLVRFVDYDPRQAHSDNPWRITRVVRDQAERESAIRNRKLEAGQDEDQLDPDTLNPAPAADSEYSYDPNGNVVELLVDGKSRQSGYEGDERRTIAYSYDRLDRETETEITGPKLSGTRTTQTAYHPSGERRSRTKPNGTTESFAYTPHGELRSHRTEKADGSTSKNQSYAYDPNGNRTRDERGTYEFNPRDQLTSWTRSARFSDANPEAGNMAGSTVSYELDPQGQITKQTDGFQQDGQTSPTTITYTYEGERLRRSETATSFEGGASTTHTTRFRYDELGTTTLEIQTSEFSGPIQPPDTEHDPTPNPPTPEGCEGLDSTPENVPDGAKLIRYCHDAFERLIATRGAEITDDGSEGDEHTVEEPANYRYDALDRREAKVSVTDEEQAKATRYDHVGLTTRLTREAATLGDQGAETDDERKRFDISSSGEYLGLATADDPDDAETHKPYLLDAQGSIEGLEGSDGSIGGDDRYLYDPYGNLANVTGPGEEGLSEDASSNPIRFQGFHYDSGIKTYDMHARNYRPEVARFLTEDRYQAAGADQNLVSDPLTQNRYAFLGGNPVSNIEFDGHLFCSIPILGAVERALGGCKNEGKGAGGGGGSQPAESNHQQEQMQQQVVELVEEALPEQRVREARRTANESTMISCSQSASPQPDAEAARRCWQAVQPARYAEELEAQYEEFRAEVREKAENLKTAIEVDPSLGEQLSGTTKALGYGQLGAGTSLEEYMEILLATLHAQGQVPRSGPRGGGRGGEIGAKGDALRARGRHRNQLRIDAGRVRGEQLRNFGRGLRFVSTGTGVTADVLSGEYATTILARGGGGFLGGLSANLKWMANAACKTPACRAAKAAGMAFAGERAGDILSATLDPRR